MKHNQNNEPVLTRKGQANAKAMKFSKILTDYRLCLAGLASISGHIPGEENSDEAVELQEQTYLTRGRRSDCACCKNPD